MREQTQCCIAGAGPAGMLLALLLARKGVKVKLLEMHSDLDRDFRGDTVHASTMEILDQIGLAEGALELPHAKIREMSIRTPTGIVTPARFKRLKTKFPYVAMMPQENFLGYLQECASKYDGFELLFSSVVTGLKTDDNGRVTGVKVKQGKEQFEIQSDLVVACDGRFSKIRRMAGLSAPDDKSVPMDVAWFRLPKIKTDDATFAGFYIADGNLLIVLDRPDQWQMGYIFPKGNYSRIKKSGIELFRTNIQNTIPWMDDRVEQLNDFKDVHVLNIKSDRLDTWHTDGLLLIGDAAHVMSPVGGVGINFAIADAVEAANVLTEPLMTKSVTTEHLAEVQNRRFKATKTMQGIQNTIARNIVKRAMNNADFKMPMIAKLLLSTPIIRDIPARMIAFGPRRVRIENP